MKYLMCRMKMLEKDDIINETTEKSTVTFPDSNGVQQSFEVQRPKALSVRYLDFLLGNLHIRAAKAWKTFDYYLEVILAFAIHSPQELEEKWTGE